MTLGVANSILEGSFPLEITQAELDEPSEVDVFEGQSPLIDGQNVPTRQHEVGVKFTRASKSIIDNLDDTFPPILWNHCGTKSKLRLGNNEVFTQAKDCVSFCSHNLE